MKDAGKVKKGVDILVKVRTDMPEQYHSFSDPRINGALKELMQKKQAAGLEPSKRIISNQNFPQKNRKLEIRNE